MSDLLKKHNTRVNFIGSGKSPEQLLESYQSFARDYTSIPKQERVQEAIDIAIRYRIGYNLNPIESIDIESVQSNTAKQYDDMLKMLSYSIEQWYDLRNSITCDITGKKIPYNTNYFILSIPETENDLVLSVEGLKQLCDSASELLK